MRRSIDHDMPRTRFKAPRLGAFCRDENGTVTIFALMMFILMLAAGGIAIDVMRYDTQRSQLQYTLDRAVLAAASLSQQEDPEAVVIDYFATSGLENYRLDVDVEEGLNFRRVTASAEMDIQAYFMNMFGVNALTSPARGSAEERVMDIEISVVLDISGSMGWNNKIRNMRNAANEFVDTVLELNEGETERVSVSIIPYNSQVNAGSTLASVFTLSDEHDRSNCTRFDPSDYNSTGIDPDDPIERIAHFDYRYRNSYTTFRTPHCTTSDYGAILPWSNDADDLHGLINSLNANGNTAIDLGMRWAVGLLDPMAQPALSELIDAGAVNEDFEGRPYSYDEDEVLKIVILMTDGENTSQHDIAQGFKRGPSTLFRDPDSGRTSAYLPNYDLYYWHHNGNLRNSPYGGSDAEPIPWPELWASYSARMLAGEYYYYAGDWDYYYDLRYDAVERYAGANQADANLRNICDAANDTGIVIFTIAFEAPTRGQNVMQHCASTPANYYNAEGIEISEAFASIAASINQLRLIQ